GVELRRRFHLNRDKVVGRQVEMVLANVDLVAHALGGEEDDKVVAGIFFELGSLVLLADVFDRQGMEFEDLLQNLVILIVRSADVEPESALLGNLELTSNRIARWLFDCATGRDQSAPGSQI